MDSLLSLLFESNFVAWDTPFPKSEPRDRNTEVAKKNGVKVIPYKKVLDSCTESITSRVIPVILMLGVLALPIACYFFHVIPEIEMWRLLTAVAMVAVSIKLLKMNHDDLSVRAKNLPFYKQVVNGKVKIENIDLNALIKCLGLAPFDEQTFFSLFDSPKPRHYFFEANYVNKNEVKFLENNKSLQEQSSYSDLGFKEPQNGARIGFINGILNNYPGAYQSALLISHLSGGYNVHIVHNASHGMVDDLWECVQGLLGIPTEPVLCLHAMWDAFFFNPETPRDAQFLQICHSQGAIHVNNALKRYPPCLRERIQVVAVAPGAFISDSLANATHYMSWDPVPHVDNQGRKAAQSIFYCQTENWENHSFSNEIYFEPLKKELTEFLCLA